MKLRILKSICSPPLGFLKKVFPILFLSIFFVSFFSVTGCSQRKGTPLTSLLEDEEKKDLEYLLRLLLFENHGAFVWEQASLRRASNEHR